MVTMADWIKVELTDAEYREATQLGELRQARSGHFKPKGLGDLRTNTLGVLGEMTVAKYIGAELPPEHTWEADVQRGYDVGDWEVRCNQRASSGLGLNPGDERKRPFIHVLAHEAPVMWLTGWIAAADGFPVAVERETNGHKWWCVDQSFLHPLPERNGYYRRGADGWLVDPQTPFNDEACGMMHPLIEHRICRAKLAYQD
jgi:hypothetical protein